MPSFEPTALKVTVVTPCRGDWKSGFGSVSFSLDAAFVLVAFTPIPRRANASQSSAWFAPPKRIMSAARYASRASSMDGAVGMSTIASKTSWIQRRLPGQRSAGR